MYVYTYLMYMYVEMYIRYVLYRIHAEFLLHHYLYRWLLFLLLTPTRAPRYNFLHKPTIRQQENAVKKICSYMYLNNNTGPLNARTRRFCRITRDGKKKTLAIVEKSIRNFIFYSSSVPSLSYFTNDFRIQDVP